MPRPAFYNTLTRSVDEFTSITPKTVLLYSCGPTVYDFQHIGNLSNPVFVDILKRTLTYAGYTIQHVTNFTDFGHLTSDADDGDDKMMKGLKREGLAITMENMHALGKQYADAYIHDLRALGIATDDITFPYASEYVPQQIAMAESLVQKGYAYETSDGVYFDVLRFPAYGALGGVDLQAQNEAYARVSGNTEKHHPADFALWKKNTELGWESPWGKGFPGWHIECSAMSRALLGPQIDIHTGGIEHISIHHNGEIAQSECASGKKPFSRFWMHRAHIRIDEQKISKSIGNTIYLRHIDEKGFSPLSYRYWLLTAHYRTPANFTWEALEASHTAYKKLLRIARELKTDTNAVPDSQYLTRFWEHAYNDLDTPKALALVWEMVRDTTLNEPVRYATISACDTLLGLNLVATDTHVRTLTPHEAPADIQTLKKERDEARAQKNYAESDRLRDELRSKGYDVTDTGGTSTLSSL